MSTTKAKLLLAFIITLRASSFMFSKLAMGQVGPFELMFLRFFPAFLAMAVVFRKKVIHADRNLILSGMAMGAAYFALLTFEMYGLKHTSSTAVTAFLENTSIVIVPLLGALLTRSLPTVQQIVPALVALSGVGLLTLGQESASFGLGEILGLCGAVAYASAIIICAKVSRTCDPLALGMFQNGFLGLFALVASLIMEDIVIPSSTAFWGQTAYLVIVCTIMGHTLQPVAQRYLPAETAGLFCALNPLVAMAMGSIFLGERFGGAALTGCALILGSIVLSHFMSRSGALRSVRRVRPHHA